MAWLLLGKPDLSMILNGCLAGLVAITARCAFVSVPSALAIGTLAGIVVVLAVLFFDRLQLDDPVGALSVHLVNGVFGTLVVGLFADKGLAASIGTDTPALRDGLRSGAASRSSAPRHSVRPRWPASRSPPRSRSGSC